MKTTFLFLMALVISTMSTAQDTQLAIGKTTVDGDGLIDFGTETRGIVLAPIEDISTMSPAPSAGTIAFDGATGSFKFFDGTSWSETVSGGQIGGHATGTDTYQQLIGTSTSSATGVVVLGEDTGETKALVLPKIANGNLRFNNPVAGLIYYDTVSKRVMVYNGEFWTSF